MHKFLLTALITSVAWFATAQTTTLQPAPTSGRTGTTAKPSAPPRTEPATSTYNPNTAATPRLTPKSGTLRPEAANVNTARATTTTPRTAAKPGASRPESSVERNASTTTARPSRTSAAKSTTSRYNGSGTARKVTTPAKKAVVKPVKPVEPGRVNWITLE